MKLSSTLVRADDRGVSPLIGAVLFIGVSVIVMAGLAAMVLGFTVFQSTTQADLVYEQEGTEIEIGVKSADGLTGSETRIQIQGGESCGDWDALGGTSGTIENGDVVSFDTSDCSFSGGDTVQVIGSATLVSTYEVRG